MAQKVAKAVFTLKVIFFKTVQNVTNYLGCFCEKTCSQEILKIAQSSDKQLNKLRQLIWSKSWTNAAAYHGSKFCLPTIRPKKWFLPPLANLWALCHFSLECNNFLMSPPRPLFVYFCFFKQHFTLKTADFSRIQNLIVSVEGEHADH